MKIGVLQCDYVRSSLSPVYGEYATMFENALRAVSPQPDELTFQVYPAHEGILPDAVEECEAYIITGSRHSVLDSEALWIHQLQNFIVRLHKSQIKTIGVCFGHQIMAVAMGGKVERADCGWQIGVQHHEVLQQAACMAPEAGSFNTVMFCEDQVVKVAEGAHVLATAPNCEFAMVQYGDHMLSIQGHPEMSNEFTLALLEKSKEDFPAKRYEKGLASVSEKSMDSCLLFSWFYAFLTANPAEEKQ